MAHGPLYCGSDTARSLPDRRSAILSRLAVNAMEPIILSSNTVSCDCHSNSNPTPEGLTPMSYPWHLLWAKPGEL